MKRILKSEILVKMLESSMAILHENYTSIVSDEIFEHVLDGTALMGAEFAKLHSDSKAAAAHFGELLTGSIEIYLEQETL